MVKEVRNHFRSILTPEGGVPRRAEFIHNNNNNNMTTDSGSFRPQNLEVPQSSFHGLFGSGGLNCTADLTCKRISTNMTKLKCTFDIDNVD